MCAECPVTRLPGTAREKDVAWLSLLGCQKTPCANHRPELADDYHGRFEFGFQTEVLGSAATGQQPRTALQMHSLSAGEEPTGLGAMHVLMSCGL